MKRVIIIIALLTASMTAQSNSKESQGTLILKIFGFGSKTGKILLRIDDTKEGYEGHKDPVKRFVVEVKNSTVEIPVDSLAFGSYTVKCFHDANSNGVLDKNFMGIPSEGYGFSNNAVGFFGPPSFEDALFKFTKTGQIQKIGLQ